jgi:hypothetical protein
MMIVLKIAKSLWPEGVGYSRCGKSSHPFLDYAYTFFLHITNFDFESIPEKMAKAEFVCVPRLPQQLNVAKIVWYFDIDPWEMRRQHLCCCCVKIFPTGIPDSAN